MKEARTAFAIGLLFGGGLAVSGMVRPDKVAGFLDVGGAWDPTLAFVMAAALAVFLPAYRMIMRLGRPVVAEQFDIVSRSDITPRLVMGAVIFGVGWGISGFCPGAAIAAIPGFNVSTWIVLAGMAGGMIGTKLFLAASDPMPDLKDPTHATEPSLT